MLNPENIIINIEVNPIKIAGVIEHNIENEFPLWNSINAIENYIVTGERYILKLYKGTSDHSKVYIIESELIDALQQLCFTWPFVCGYQLHSFSNQIQVFPNFKSNSVEVENLLKRNVNLASVNVGLSFEATIYNEYKIPPLKMAIDLCLHSQRDIFLKGLLRYYYLTRFDHTAWYIHLYKIKDVLCFAFAKMPGAPKKKRRLSKFICAKLKINPAQWSYFGKTLNKGYDLRHPTIGTTPALNISDQEREKVMELGKNWINNYCKYNGYF